MKVKVKVKEAKKAKEKGVVYPFIGVGTQTRVVVLFTGVSEGVVLEKNDGSQCVGEFHKHWDMPYFTPFKGKLILSND